MLTATKTAARALRAAIQDPAAKLLVLKAKAELERERVDAIQRQVLAEMGTGITDPSRSYLLDDADAERYFERLNAIHAAAGFPGAEQGYCPACCAESDVRDAERDLIEAARPWTGIDRSTAALKLDKYRRFVDLLLGLALSKD